MVEITDGDLDIKIIKIESPASIDKSPQAVAERLLAKPTVIHLFTDGPDNSFNISAMSEYLQATFGSNFTFVNEGDIWQCILAKDPVKKEAVVKGLAQAKKWASASDSHMYKSSPLTEAEKIDLEEKALDRGKAPFREFALGQRIQKNDTRRPAIIHDNEYYNASEFIELCRRQLPEGIIEGADDTRWVSIVFTGRGIGEDDRGRIHMRAGIAAGNLAVISSTGIVEAPEKPEEVRRAYQRFNSLGSFMPDTAEPERIRRFIDEMKLGKPQELALQLAYEDQMLHHGDPRLTEVMKGITLQMILFSSGETTSGVAQCSSSDLSLGKPDVSKNCRLHDGHWQEEIIATQLKSDKPEFCQFHTELFAGLHRPPKLEIKK